MSYSAKLKEQLKKPTEDGEENVEEPNEEKIAELEEEVKSFYPLKLKFFGGGTDVYFLPINRYPNSKKSWKRQESQIGNLFKLQLQSL
jgi:hypothetical protein